MVSKHGVPMRHLEHLTAEPLCPVIRITLAAAIRAQPAIAAKGKALGFVAVWTIVNVTAPIMAFAVHHLLLFFSLYRPYLPARDSVIEVPIVID
jgi:hypothetical protein